MAAVRSFELLSPLLVEAVGVGRLSRSELRAAREAVKVLWKADFGAGGVEVGMLRRRDGSIADNGFGGYFRWLA